MYSYNGILSIDIQDRSRSVDDFRRHLHDLCRCSTASGKSAEWFYKCDTGYNGHLSSYPPGCPLLVMAAEYGRADFVKLLASEFGCSVNVAASAGSSNEVRKGRSALHLAVYYGHVETVRALLDLGANPNALDLRGKRPVHMMVLGIQGRQLYLGKQNRNGLDNQHRLETPRYVDILRMLTNAPGSVGFDAGALEGLEDADFHFFKNEGWRKILRVLAPDSEADLSVTAKRGTDSDHCSSYSPLQGLEIHLLSRLNEHVVGMQNGVVMQYRECRVLEWAMKAASYCHLAVEKARSGAEDQIRGALEARDKVQAQKDVEIASLARDVENLTSKLREQSIAGKENLASDDPGYSKSPDTNMDSNQKFLFGQDEPLNALCCLTSKSLKEHIESIASEWRECTHVKRLRDALNGSLNALSLELYASEMHFLDELIQNAIDSDATAVRVCLATRGLCIANNGASFSPEGVASICSVGQSSKAGGSDSIGHKGLGFKSVFRASDGPYIRSGEWSFGFVLDDDLIESFLIPRWIEPEHFFAAHPWLEVAERECVRDEMATRIYLPFSEKARQVMDSDKVRDYLLDLLKEGLSLKLWKRVQEFSIWDATTGVEDIFKIGQATQAGGIDQAISAGGDDLQLQNDSFTGTINFARYVASRTRVGREECTAMQSPSERAFLFVSSQAEINPTVNPLPRLKPFHPRQKAQIALCFPLGMGETMPSDSYPLFAHLPVRLNGGLPFILNADWLVASSRESILESEVGWNRALRDTSANVVAECFVQCLKGGALNAHDDACMRSHLSRTLELPPTSLWLSKFKKSVIIRLMESRTDCKIFNANNRHKLLDIEKMIPDLDSKLEKLSIFLVQENDVRIPELSLYDLIQHEDERFFGSKTEDWWVCFFSAMLDFANGDRFDKEGYEFMEQVFWSIPMFLFLEGSFRERNRLSRSKLYLLRPTDTADFPFESLPGIVLLDFDSQIEKQFLVKLGVKIADEAQAVRLLLLHHIALCIPKIYEAFGKFDHSARLGLQFLYKKRAHLATQWQNILSSDDKLSNLKESLRLMDIYVQSELDGSDSVIRTELLNPDPDMLLCPRLWIPCRNNEEVLAILPAKGAHLARFMTLLLSVPRTGLIYVHDDVQVQHCSDAISSALFDLFLLDLGSTLPSLSSCDQILLEGKDERCLDECIRAMRESLLEFQADVLSSVMGESRTERRILSNGCRNQQFVFELIGYLKSLEEEDYDGYKRLLRSLQDGLHRHRRRQALPQNEVRDIYLQRLEVGQKGELIAYTWFRDRADSRSDDCAIEWTSRENELAGYDFLVSSRLIFAEDEVPSRRELCRVEVKAWARSSPDSFHVSRNEHRAMRASRQDGFEYVVLLVSDVGSAAVEPSSIAGGLVHSLIDANALLSLDSAAHWVEALIPLAAIGPSWLRSIGEPVRVPSAAGTAPDADEPAGARRAEESAAAASESPPGAPSLRPQWARSGERAGSRSSAGAPARM